MRRTDHLTVVALAMAAVIALGACGSSNTTPATNPGGGGTPAPSSAAGGGGATANPSAGGGGATATAPAGTSSSGGGGGELADQCSLLTADEVGAAYNKTGVRPTITDGFFSKVCQYLPKSGTIAMLWVDVTPVAARPCDKWKSVGTAVPNLGDWAYWQNDTAELYVKTGDRCLVLGDHFNTLADTQKSLAELARKALGRL